MSERHQVVIEELEITWATCEQLVSQCIQDIMNVNAFNCYLTRKPNVKSHAY